MRSLRSLLLAVVALTIGSATAQAQRRITGQVTGADGTPLASASVQVVGTQFGTFTGEDGRYSVSAPDGDVTLRVRRLGFKQRDIAVAANQNEANVQLERDVLQLETQVITGAATTVARRNAANDIAVVSGEQLNRAPTPTIENALQGKIAGATIQSNSGAPGGGLQVQLRGVTTINAAVDPLYVIDGVIVSNEAVSPNINSVTRAANGANASDQDNPVNRIADINPADIQSIEVLKGASASAIYGSKAANGVIIITTKRGTTGAPRFNVTQRLGTFDLSNKIGSRTWTLPSAIAFFHDGLGVPEDLIEQQIADGTTDFEQKLYGRNDLSWETDASVTGGTDQTQYYVSALLKNDKGIMEGTGFKKQSIRANVTQQFSDKINATLTTNFIRTEAERGLSNNDNAGVSPFMVLPFAPSWADLLPQNGVFPENPFERSNPFQTVALFKNDEDVYRFIGSGQVNWSVFTTARQHLDASLVAGVDQFNQTNNVFSPPELFFEDDDGFTGTTVRGDATSTLLTLNLNVSHEYTPESNAFTATTSAGIQREVSDLNTTSTVVDNIFSGQPNVGLGSRVQPFQTRQQERTLAYYGQEEFLTLGERLFATVGVRAERSTNNGDVKKFFFYPKASASYRFLNPVSFLDELKFRVAWGQAGNKPLFGMKFTNFGTGSTAGFLGEFVNPAAVLGNPDIEPERQTEIETGFDAQFLKQRASASVTLYQKSIKDLILQRTPAPSSGFTAQLFNGAALRNRGIEVTLAATPVLLTDFDWVSRVTFARNYSKITELPVPTFDLAAGFGTSLGAFRIEKGSSATQIVGINEDGDVIRVGDAAPDFQMGFSNEFSWKTLRLASLFDWKHGGDVINLTRFLFDAFQNSADQTDDPNSPGAIRAARLGTRTKDFVEDAGYVKLREVTLSWQLPGAWVSTAFGGRARSARLELSGRNLWTWTSYSGSDPEVSNFGNQAIARNIDVAPFPPSRSYFFSVSVDF
ncbi:MAG TPA: SusC/RagA family TonB-linked outer membrane protein [Gemmatimonadaceae bacterium]|nr:SusC/RagA family TonB-linked outer membrane protein [Gemmatimonadaceae bacterium]